MFAAHIVPRRFSLFPRFHTDRLCYKDKKVTLKSYNKYRLQSTDKVSGVYRVSGQSHVNIAACLDYTPVSRVQGTLNLIAFRCAIQYR